jgi:hypothetical protein
MALSLLFMGLNVSVDFGLYAVQAVGNDAVVVLVVFHQSMNKCNDHREAATNNSNENTFAHVITVLEGMGCLV